MRQRTPIPSAGLLRLRDNAAGVDWRRRLGLFGGDRRKHVGVRRSGLVVGFGVVVGVVGNIRLVGLFWVIRVFLRIVVLVEFEQQ